MQLRYNLNEAKAKVWTPFKRPVIWNVSCWGKTFTRYVETNTHTYAQTQTHCWWADLLVPPPSAAGRMRTSESEVRIKKQYVAMVPYGNWGCYLRRVIAQSAFITSSQSSVVCFCQWVSISRPQVLQHINLCILSLTKWGEKERKKERHTLVETLLWCWLKSDFT